MSVTINLGAWRSVFAVPSKVVDEGLKFSDGVKLKVLLYVLRNADKTLDKGPTILYSLRSNRKGRQSRLMRIRN